MIQRSPTIPTPVGQPAWELAELFPHQGEWTEDAFFALDANRLIELSNGRLEVLPMPSDLHQQIVFFLQKLIDAFLAGQDLGIVLAAPLPVRLWEGTVREPDLVVLLSADDPRRREQFWRGADLAVEVVSPGGRKRDLKTKRAEYAQAGIKEYWIVDPSKQAVTILFQEQPKAAYTVIGEYQVGDEAKSRLLSGLRVKVKDVFKQK